MVTLSLLLSGCLESIDEVMDPDLSIRVERTWIQTKNDEGQEPLTGSTWTYMTVNITSHNEDHSHPIDIYQFYARDTTGEWHWCRGPEDRGEISIGPGDSISLDIYFEVPKGRTLERLEYRRMATDPISCPVPGFISV